MSSSSPPRVAQQRTYGGIPSYSLYALVFLWLIYALNASTRQLLFFVLPSIVTEYQLTPEMTGIVSAIVTVSASLLALPLGPWFDKGGHGWARKYRNAVMAVGYFIFTILGGIAALTSSIWSFVTLQSVKNAFGGAGEAIEVSTMAESAPVEKRGLFLGLQHTAYPWGTLITSLLVGGILTLAGTENWRDTFLIVPLSMVPIWISYWLFATKKRYTRFEEQTIAAGYTAPLRDGDEPHEPAAPGALGRALRNPNIVVPSIAALLGIAVYTGISFWLPQYIAFVGNYSFAEAAAYAAVFTITGGVGQILWGHVSDTLGRKFTSIITFVWLGIGIFMLQLSSQGLIWLVGLQLFLGMATNGIFPVLYSFVADAAERGGLGTANSVLLTTMYLGGASPLALGFLISAGGGYTAAAGYNWSLYIMGGACILAALLLVLFTRETVGKFKSRDRALVSPQSCGQAPVDTFA